MLLVLCKPWYWIMFMFFGNTQGLPPGEPSFPLSTPSPAPRDSHPVLQLSAISLFFVSIKQNCLRVQTMCILVSTGASVVPSSQGTLSTWHSECFAGDNSF